MDQRPWEDAHPALLARLTGAGGIAFAVVTFLPGQLGGPLFDDGLTTPGLLGWVRSSVGSLPAEGVVAALSATLVPLFLVALARLIGGRGLLATLNSVGAATFLAVNWISAGAWFALSDAARRADADGAVIGLFSLVKGLVFADGVALGLSILALTAIGSRLRTLPRPVRWLGLLAGGVHLVSLPVQLAVDGGFSGVTGPVSVVVGLAWLLAVALLLVIRPVRLPQGLAAPAPAGA